ncbi:hypothetical protein M758_4G208100 [Ceratodon purpureus]|nr:hypothetical protein M758_4G208100 [Ceratodon purpureus]
MAVHFKFASLNSNLYDSIPLVDDSISLRDLKDEIYELKIKKTEGRRLKEPMEFRIFDCETNEEITGNDTRIRKNSSVVVKRVPAKAHAPIVMNCEEPLGSKAFGSTGKMHDNIVQQEVSNLQVKEEPNHPISIKELMDQYVIPSSMVCPLCHGIMDNPMLIPCCCLSFCCNCVTKYINEQHKCPECGSSKCDGTNLLSNHHAKTLIQAYPATSPLIHAGI